MKRKISAILLLVLLCLYLSVNVLAVYDITIGSDDYHPIPNVVDKNGNPYADAPGTFISKYKNLAVFAGGLFTITMVGAVIFNVARLNLTMGNPMQRQQCLRGILICGTMAGLIGSATLFIGLFYGALQ